MKRVKYELTEKGYEVGYAQANTEAGLPKSIIDEIREEAVKKALDETLVTYKDMPAFAPRKDGKLNWEGLWSLTMELQKIKRKIYLDKLGGK